MAISHVGLQKQKRFLHKNRVQCVEDCFGTTTWPPFLCFGTPNEYGCRDIRIHRASSVDKEYKKGTKNVEEFAGLNIRALLLFHWFLTECFKTKAKVITRANRKEWILVKRYLHSRNFYKSLSFNKGNQQITIKELTSYTVLYLPDLYHGQSRLNKTLYIFSDLRNKR